MQPKRNKSEFGENRTEDSERAILLDSESDEEDDDVLGFSKPSSHSNHRQKPDSNLSKVKADILSVTKTMQSNMAKVLDRGTKIEDLQDKTEDLDLSAFKFVHGSRKLQRKMWWQNMKLKLLFGFIVFALLLILIVSLVIKKKKK